MADDLSNDYRPEGGNAGLNDTKTRQSGARQVAAQQASLIPLDTKPPSELKPKERDVWARVVGKADWLAENQRDLVTHVVRLMARMHARVEEIESMRAELRKAFTNSEEADILKQMRGVVSDAEKQCRAEEASILKMLNFLGLQPDNTRLLS